MTPISGKRILLIITGGIAAYKTLELIRLVRKDGGQVRCILTKGGANFVTPLALSALSGDKVYQDIFSLTDETEIGHIELSRQADLLVVAPATAHVLAQMAQGLAGDLATTALLATDKPIMIAPSMNVAMFEHPATQTNLATLAARGVIQVGPDEGDMACGEYGLGRMAEPDAIRDAISAFFDPAQAPATGPLSGKKAIVTSGPTHEAIDPVRYIANRSSGKQGHAIAAALARLGAETLLVTGPTAQPDPPGVQVVPVLSAVEMLDACTGALPADIAICCAAVADWRVDNASVQKLKKSKGAAPPSLCLVPNPDILATLAQAASARPALVIGFAAETERVVEQAQAKRIRKGCDWIVANDVSPATGTFGGDHNTVHLISETKTDDWPTLTKRAVAERLAQRIVDHFDSETT